MEMNENIIKTEAKKILKDNDIATPKKLNPEKSE